jgi:MYXO-CTERM domain-containing protein
LYPKTYQSTTSPAALDSARSQLAQLILQATGKNSVPAPPTTGETSPGTGTGAVPPIVPVVAKFPAGGGCSSSGPQSAWLLLPLFGLALLRRRRSAA